MASNSRSTSNFPSPDSHERAPRILLADGDSDFRQTLERALASFPYEVSVVSDGAQAVAMVRQHQTDVIITELKMPRLSGLDLLSLVKEASPMTEVIILTTEGNFEDVVFALRARAFDFLLKSETDVRQLLLAIERALNQRSRPERRMESEGPQRLRTPAASANLLSARELEVLKLAGEGLGNKKIAEKLSLSEKTVRNHLSSAYQKLGVANRTQAAGIIRRLRLG